MLLERFWLAAGSPSSNDLCKVFPSWIIYMRRIIICLQYSLNPDIIMLHDNGSRSNTPDATRRLRLGGILVTQGWLAFRA